MEIKKTIAFYCCTNGLGHFKRVTEVAKYLVDTHDVTIFCNQRQIDKIGLIQNVNYVKYSIDNIRWDKILNGDINTVEQEYFAWVDKYGPTTFKFDIVVSDNIVGLLKYRFDTILMGSFLWKDVFKSKLGDNKITSHDEILLEKYNPILITNKYVETQSVKYYNNKTQFGFGCEPRMQVAADIKNSIWLSPSLDYGVKYARFIDKLCLEKELNLGIINNLSYIYNVRMIARPGVGTITHCVEHYIPLVALYSNDDSEEIKELAQIVEDLKIGFKQNIDEPVRVDQFKMQWSNTNYCYAGKFEKEGYKNISNYIKNL